MESESCMRGWGICQGQVEVVNDQKEEIYLKISRLKQIEPGVLLFSLQHNTLDSTKKTELHPLQAIQSVYNPTSEFPPPQGYRTIVIEVGELHTTDNLPSINSHTPYEIMSSEEIDHYFSVHPVKKTRNNFDPQIAVRQLNVNIWQDGLSGNRTKKWNPHECTLLSFPGLVQQNHNSLQFIVLTGSLLMMKEDNPASSELANHAWQGSYPCRLCLHHKNEVTSEDSHLPSLMQVAEYCNLRATIAILLQEIHNPSSRVLSCAGLKVSQGISPLFFLLDFDPFKDQLFERLHTWLLGPLKHVIKAFLGWNPLKTY
ncbi:hypothetical protein L873DRAFT_197667 [Choiromyces venosus 120613-1]|uniref:Uncharacterized protein n=1 Tax=Choiromyces venosus 120613-1 TaxID=1336337 RepID=A0A3N4J1U0_9PEZI|nr:hypothetical protein L873DRAFT_197667 [Choiromyces venosus 120613-1]